GDAAEPEARFDLAASAVNAAPLSAFGVGPLAAEVSGTYADERLTLASARVSGPGGVEASASGTLPRFGSSGELSVRGSLPLSLAGQNFAGRGTQFSGTLAFDIAVAGSLSDPVWRGTLSASGAGVVDPASNLRFESLALDATLVGDALVLRSLGPDVATGCSVS